MSEIPATPALEVVICTCNNAAMLDGVLSTLACQRHVGQPQGIWRVLNMSPSCRHELLGRARPVSGRDLSRPGEVG